jgi:hypothetical protein
MINDGDLNLDQKEGEEEQNISAILIIYTMFIVSTHQHITRSG